MGAENNPGSEKRMLTEPITRPDGMVIKIMQQGNLVTLEEGPADGSWAIEAAYTTEEVNELGLGNFYAGVARLGYAAFTAGGRIVGDLRYFSEKLKK